jgi:hypothetical protein
LPRNDSILKLLLSSVGPVMAGLGLTVHHPPAGGGDDFKEPVDARVKPGQDDIYLS